MEEGEIKQIKRSGHGGFRPGAGRKPSRDKRPSCADCQDPRAAALALAVKGCRSIQFVLAMLSLGAPPDDIRRALGISQSQFAGLYGSECSGGRDRP